MVLPDWRTQVLAQRGANFNRPTGRKERNCMNERLYTVGELAMELDQKLHQITYLLDVKHVAAPVQWAGGKRLYDFAAIEKLRAAIIERDGRKGDR